MDVLDIVVASTFTAEPVEPFLAFWLNKLGWKSTVRFTPFNQVVQQLLEPGSLLGRNREGVNTFLIRVEDWVPGDAPGVETRLEESAAEFLNAFRRFADRSSAPRVVVLLSGLGQCREPAALDAARRIAQSLSAALRDLPSTHVLSSVEILQGYPVMQVEDPEADVAGAIPFTREMFAAVGTSMARWIRRLRLPPPKVIVVDADQTLWGGVVAEEGVAGVRLEAGHLELQRRLLEQREAGALLCLCSKNAEADVWEVFERRPEMRLRREHFTASRINWLPKSGNVRSLALELNLGLSGFLLLDDNPAECAEVRAGCPGVIAVTLPAHAAAFAPFLAHLWPIDPPLRVTEEDRRRAALYRENLRRDQFQRQQSSLVAFIEGLRLEVRWVSVRLENLGRVAQLTARTNQFNATTRRRSEAEIQEFLRRDRCDALGVEVSDRFGDYGLVGLLLFEMAGDALVVDTFLLSCRALGKGIEHRMVAALGARAAQWGVHGVEIPFQATRRNQPMRDFLQSLAAAREMPAGEAGCVCYRLGVAEAAGTKFEPGRGSPLPVPASEGVDPAPAEAGAPGPDPGWVYEWIASEMREPAVILERIDAAQRRSRPRLSSRFEPPSTAVEAFLARTWARALNLDAVGVTDDFFELGGTSILGVYAINELQRCLGEHVHVAVLFEAPTIVQLARWLRARHPEASARLEAALGDSVRGAVDRVMERRWPEDPERARELLARLDALSDSDVEELLLAAPGPGQSEGGGA
jgi:FkbH-like protein